MPKKTNGKTLLNKLLDALPVIGRDARRCAKEKSIREMEKNLITSDTTVKVVWIMSLLVLSVVMQTGLGNPKDHPNGG